MASIQVGGGCVQVVVTITDEMTKAATGLTIHQIDMLRAVFEDQFGIDPATLTMDEIMVTARSVIDPVSSIAGTSTLWHSDLHSSSQTKG